MSTENKAHVRDLSYTELIALREYFSDRITTVDPNKRSDFEKQCDTELNFLDRYIVAKFNKLRTESK